MPGLCLSVTALARLTRPIQGGGSSPAVSRQAAGGGMQVGTNILGTAEKAVPFHL